MLLDQRNLNTIKLHLKKEVELLTNVILLSIFSQEWYIIAISFIFFSPLDQYTE